MSNIIEQLKAARRVSTPIVAITTADQWAMLSAIDAAFNGGSPKVVWDGGRGLRGINAEGKDAIKKMANRLTDGDVQALADKSTRIDIALSLALELPERSITVWVNAHRWVSERIETTSWLNLRQPFKSTNRMAILIGPQFNLPSELQSDIVLFDDPLPSDERLALIINETYAAFLESFPETPALSDEVRAHSVDALRGLSEFTAEQVFAMSLDRKVGVITDSLWSRKKAQVEQTRGLSINIGGLTFAAIGGLNRILAFFTNRFKGKAKPGCIMRIDEIEKHLAGAEGDLTGISQDFVGTLLRTMEDRGWNGLIAFGPPGTGKSIVSKVAGATFGVPTLELDLGALKGGIVGESETAIRQALKVVDGIGSGRVFVVATCNKLDILPPELKRRFRAGVWMFDLPGKGQREAIWKIHLAAHPDVKPDRTFDDSEWTGAEIRNVIEMADDDRITLDEAAKYITPVSAVDPEKIRKAREVADGRFLSAETEGLYSTDKAPAEIEKRRAF